MPASVSTSQVPVIDFSLFTDGTAEQRLHTAREIVAAFKEVGFVYLVNHEITDETIEQAFQQVGDLRVLYTGPVLRPLPDQNNNN